MISNQKDNFLYENMRNEIEKSFLVPHITKKQDQLPAILLHRNALKCWEVTLYVKVTEKPITAVVFRISKQPKTTRNIQT